jgi:hypothetical protein|tara:strand:- start:167 stop:442 length:276 start_codon:yes stop_codon:yes gene_type:complete
MKVEESIYDKQFKTLRKGEWFEPTGFEHKVSLCGKFATTADVLTLYAPLGHGTSIGGIVVEDYMLTYPCNYFEREAFINAKGYSVILWRSI